MSGPEKLAATLMVIACALLLALIVSKHLSDQAALGVRPSADEVIHCSDECIRACVRANDEEVVFE